MGRGLLDKTGKNLANDLPSNATDGAKNPAEPSIASKAVGKVCLQSLSTNAARFEAASVERNQQAEKYYKFICLCLFVYCQLPYSQRGVAGVKMLYTEFLS